MLKQIKTFNKVHKQDSIFGYDKCKKLHNKLFNKVLIKLLSTKKMHDIKTHLQILIKHMLMMLNVKQIMLILYYIITYYTILIRLKK